jgi:MbtH protein
MSQSMGKTATNPFTDPDDNYRVLVNAAGEHSLWPAAVPAPSGWEPAHGPDRRDACLEYVNEAWQELRGPAPA